MKGQVSLLEMMVKMTPKAILVIDYFIDNPSFDFSKTYVAKELKISRVTVEKIWKSMVDLKIIYKRRKIGRADLYQLNRANPMVMTLMRMEFELNHAIIMKDVQTPELQQNVPIRH